MHDFEDIRPYHDDEVAIVVERLLNDLEFSQAMAKFKFPGLFNFFPGFMTRLCQFFLRKELKQVQTIHDVQIIIETYLVDLVEKTTNGFTQNGLEKLDPQQAYLFISNHRDITLDPALVNYMLYHNGFGTVQIAIGDNLLKRPFLSDLMRLNKSFIVKRSLLGREMLAASKQLSAYILHCIQNGKNVWIAQREGRAKDGIDRTEAAIIKMLNLAGRESKPKKDLRELINSLNIVPVAISYEFDPCDKSKAEELLSIDTTGKFEKNENSDVQSILNGMIGNKGNIHVSFGEPIKTSEAITAEEVANLIDEQIISNYKLHIVNYLAMEKIQKKPIDFTALSNPPMLHELNSKRLEFEERLSALPEALQPYVLNMYANPVVSQLERSK